MEGQDARSHLGVVVLRFSQGPAIHVRVVVEASKPEVEVSSQQSIRKGVWKGLILAAWDLVVFPARLFVRHMN